LLMISTSLGLESPFSLAKSRIFDASITMFDSYIHIFLNVLIRFLVCWWNFQFCCWNHPFGWWILHFSLIGLLFCFLVTIHGTCSYSIGKIRWFLVKFPLKSWLNPMAVSGTDHWRYHTYNDR
jgi:hypothetical protein